MKIHKIILLSFLLIPLFYIVTMLICLHMDLDKAKTKLLNYPTKNVELSYGNMEYLDIGSGEVLLSNHGLFGGFDQGYENVKRFENDLRIISPSRFGYLNSDVFGKGTPKEQCEAYIELLDSLHIDKVFVLGASAGGTTAIRFALDYPERCKGLILYSSAMPEVNKISQINLYQAPPDFLCNNTAMYLLSPFFKPMMSMESHVIHSMLPIDERKNGVKIDATITNPDMALNFDDYPIESLKIPTLILHAKDDKLAKFDKTLKASKRFKHLTFKIFNSGGHMLIGNDKAVYQSVLNFINENK